jgi:hypothetical protein
MIRRVIREWIVVIVAFVWLFSELGKTQRHVGIVVRTLRGCERHLDWWVAHRVVDVLHGNGPHRQEYDGNTLAHV